MNRNTKKQLGRIIVFILLAFLIGYWLYPRQEPNEYIFDKSYPIRLEDVQKSKTPLSFEQESTGVDATPSDSKTEQTSPHQKKLSSDDLKKLFSEGVINSHTTLKYFKHLEYMFKESQNLNEHLNLVKTHLFSEFSDKEAQLLFDAYRKYVACEIALAQEYRNLSAVKSMDEAIAILRKIQEFRRARMGADLADKLFGPDVKAKEYAFRRSDIVGNRTLYGKEKESLLKKLNQDMWGDEADAVEQFEPDTPIAWQRFQEKQKIYQKDLDELGSEDAKEAKIREYRSEFFTPQAVQRMEAVDKQLASEKQSEAEYREKEKTILEDNTLSEKDKKQKIETLQNQIFGAEADAFRRRETMRLELEKMAREYPVNKK